VSYRPICDVWILARPKVPYYGAYPNGFLERALPMIGASDQDCVLHLCGGRAKDYPNKRLVAKARTVDAVASLSPDYVLDLNGAADWQLRNLSHPAGAGWPAVLIDPPYTLDDHAKYATGNAEMPSANKLLRIGLDLVKPGGRVGVLHYVWPQPPKTSRSIACIGVIVGFNNRMRCFSVFERIAEPTA
jgi:hypothetical protein